MSHTTASPRTASRLIGSAGHLDRRSFLGRRSDSISCLKPRSFDTRWLLRRRPVFLIITTITSNCSSG